MMSAHFPIEFYMISKIGLRVSDIEMSMTMTVIGDNALEKKVKRHSNTKKIVWKSKTESEKRGNK